MKVEKTECNADGIFSVKINFEHLNPGTKGFKIFGNGKIYGSYTTLPVIIDGLKGDCNTVYEFIAKDLEFADCSATVEFGKVCCNEKSCTQKLINVSTSECNELGKYKLNFDLLHYNDKGLGFDLKINGEFHSFHKYSELPLKNIEVLAGMDEFNKITVCDNDNPLCCDTFEISNPCKCNIYDVRSQIAECDNLNNTYYYRMNFKHHQTSDSFYVAGVVDPAKKYAYNKLPILVGPIKFGVETDILIADKESTLCFAGITKPKIDSCVSCSIDKIEYEVLPCIGEKIYLKFTLKTSNPGVKGFSVKGNGVVYRENLSYNDEVYYIGPIIPNCDQKYEFIFTDNSNAECKKSVFIEKGLCCKSCSISNLKYETFCGIAGNGIQVNFDYTNPNDSLVVLINGVKVGTYKKGTAGITFNYPFVEGKIYSLKIYNQKDINCHLVKEFKFECIQSPCAFEITKFVQGDCNGDGTFKLTLGIKNTSGNGKQFYVKLNDMLFGPLNYGQESYTFGPIPKVCDVLRIELKDAQNEACKLVVEKEIKLCCETNDPCNITIKEFVPVCVDGKLNGVKLIVPGKEGEGFKLLLNGVEVGLYKYSNQAFIVKIPEGKDGVYKIKIWDISNPDCYKTFELDLACSDCRIKELSAKAVECTESTFRFLIDFDMVNSSDSFMVFQNGIFVGKVHSYQLPILGPVTSKLITVVHKINVIDASKKECQSVLEISKIECISNSTDLDDTKLKVYQNDRSIVVESNKFNVSGLSLYTYDGKLINQNKSKGSVVELEKQSVFGMYILHIELENGERVVRKVVNW